MIGFLLALAGAGLTGFGAADQVLVAQLSTTTRRRPSLLLTAMATAGIAIAIAVWAGSHIASLVSGPRQTLLAGLALAIAGIRLLPAVPLRAPGEPTDSLGAAAIVLLMHQVADASRWLILAIAICWPKPRILSGIWAGGALGSAAVLAIGWHYGPATLALAPRLRPLRRGLGITAILAAACLLLVCSALGNEFR